MKSRLRETRSHYTDYACVIFPTFTRVSNSEGEKKNDMNKNEALGHINSKRSRAEDVDDTCFLSLGHDCCQPACPCSLSRVNSVRVTEEKGAGGRGGAS